MVLDNELWFYYIGINQYAFISSGAVPGYDDYYPDRGAICLAVLRRDGFVSLDGDESGGAMPYEPNCLGIQPFTPATRLLSSTRDFRVPG